MHFYPAPARIKLHGTFYTSTQSDSDEMVSEIYI